MKRDKLFDLYYFLKDEKKIDLSVYSSKIYKLSNEDADLIMGSPYPEDVLEILTLAAYQYLSNDEKNTLISAVNRTTDYLIRARVLIFPDCYHLPSNEKLVPLIVAALESRNIDIASYAFTVASDPIVQARDDAIDIVRLIANARNNISAHYAVLGAGSIDLNKCDDYFKLIELVSQAKAINVQAIYDTITNKEVLKNNLSMQLGSIINMCTNGEFHSFYASHIATNETLIEKQKVIPLTTIAALAKGAWQASSVCSLISDNPKLLDNDNFLSLATIISQAVDFIAADYAIEAIPYLIDKEYGLEYLRYIAQSEYGQDVSLFIKSVRGKMDELEKQLFNIIRTSNNPYLASLASKYASDDVLRRSGKAMSIVITISRAKGNAQADFASKYIRKYVKNKKDEREYDDEIVHGVELICKFDQIKCDMLKKLGKVKFTKEAMTDYLEALTTAKSLDELKKINSLARLEYDRIRKMNEGHAEPISNTIDYSVVFDKDYDFWQLFESVPEYALSMLGTLDGDAELTPNVRVVPCDDKIRRRKKN